MPWTDSTIAAALASRAEHRDVLTAAPAAPWDDAADVLRGMFGCLSGSIGRVKSPEVV